MSLQDTEKAIGLYQAAAAQGYANAQANLGIVYAEALGVPQDDAEAIAWYQKAAEHDILLIK
ncbi:MAG: sel1 repeat family protein [Oscillospiraceae bacterium]|nr:sel1 repeat family protein [Oscillospiraceae bacterium]